jgi:hypothetical protein
MVAPVTFFCGGVATKKAMISVLIFFSSFFSTRKDERRGHFLCNKTSNKTTKKNEEKGESLPSSSYFYPLVFSLLLQAPTSSSHFFPSTFALSLQVHVLGPHFCHLVSSSHFKFQVSSNGMSAK